MAWYGNAIDYSNVNSIGFQLRKKRRIAIETLIDRVYEKVGAVRILDLGGERSYWNIFDDDYFERKNITITLLNLDQSPAGISSSKRFIQIIGDACNLPEFKDHSFDIVHSNSTIEHVGFWNRVQWFAREARRLAPVYYVQIPYYWFPIEPHFLLPLVHWVPEGVRAKILLRTGLRRDMGAAMRSIEGNRLLDRAQMAYLFPDAQRRFEWVGPFAKSLLAIRG